MDILIYTLIGLFILTFPISNMWVYMILYLKKRKSRKFSTICLSLLTIQLIMIINISIGKIFESYNYNYPFGLWLWSIVAVSSVTFICSILIIK